MSELPNLPWEQRPFVSMPEYVCPDTSPEYVGSSPITRKYRGGRPWDYSSRKALALVNPGVRHEVVGWCRLRHFRTVVGRESRRRREPDHVAIEVVFAWPGVGRLLLEGIARRDFPIVQAAVLASGLFYIVTALVVDILYAYINPRH